MYAFDFVSARSVDEVVSALAADGDGARILAGGTDIVPQLQEGRRRVKVLVDLKGVPESRALSCDPEAGLRLGAAVPCCEIYEHSAVAASYPGLVDAASLIGSVQIQSRASVGGNLCNASPAADTIPALIALGAVCRIAGADGKREVPVEDFCIAPGRTVLQQGEFLLSLHLPPPEPNSGAHYLRFIPRNEMDIAVVGVGASVVLDAEKKAILSARVALGAVAPTPLLVREAGEALVGAEIANGAIDEAVALAKAAARPITDMRGTAEQRRHLAGVLTRRALQGAIQRAKES